MMVFFGGEAPLRNVVPAIAAGRVTGGNGCGQHEDRDASG